MCLVDDQFILQMQKHQLLVPKNSRHRFEAERGSPGRTYKGKSPMDQQKIEGLHQEFQGLKEKIKDVEEKNSQVLKKIRGKVRKTQTQSDSLEEAIQDFQSDLYLEPEKNIDQNLLRTKSYERKKFSIYDDSSQVKSKYSEKESNFEEQLPTLPRKFMKTSSKAIAQEVAIEKFLNEFEENVGKEFQGIEKKISSIEEKILSLDLDVEEARRSVRFHQRKKTSESKQIKKARQRQHQFILKEAENKIRRYSNQIEKLEKSLIEKDIEIEQLSEQLEDSKQAQNSLLEKIKKKEKQHLEKTREQEKKHITEVASLRKQLKAQIQQKDDSLLLSYKPLVNHEEIVEELQQKVNKLKLQNQQYDQLIFQKAIQIDDLNSKLMESQIISSNMKKMFEELMEEHKKLQENTSKKQIEHLQSMHKLNVMVKKKVKDHDQFKKKIYTTLQEFDQSIPKKIKKSFSSPETRSTACFLILQQISLTFCYYKTQENLFKQSLKKSFNISQAEYQISGIENIFNELNSKQEKINLRISDLEQQRINLQNEIKTSLTVIKSPRASNHSQEYKLNEKINECKKQTRQKEEQISHLKKKIDLLQVNQEKALVNYETKISELNNLHRFEAKKNSDLKKEIFKLSEEIQMKEKQRIVSQNRLENILQKTQQKSKQIQDKSVQNLKQIIQLKAKIKTLENTNTHLINKRKKQQQYYELNENTNNQKMNMKQKVIDDLLKQKNDLIIENKVLSERIQLIKTEKEKKVEENLLQSQSIIRIRENNDEEIENMKNQIQQNEEKIMNLELDKRALSKCVEDLQKTLQNNESKQKIIDEKKIEEIDEIKKEMYRQKHRRQNIEQKFDNEKNEWKKNMIKKNRDLQGRGEEIEIVKNMLKQVKNKNQQLEKQIREKSKKEQQLLKIVQVNEEKKQGLMNEKINLLMNENAELKEINKQIIIKNKQNEIQFEDKIQELEKKIEAKEKDVLRLIDQRNMMKIQMTEDLDTKSDFIRTLNHDYQNEVKLLREQVQAFERKIKYKQQTIEDLTNKNHFIELQVRDLQEKSRNKQRELQSLTQNVNYLPQVYIPEKNEHHNLCMNSVLNIKLNKEIMPEQGFQLFDYPSPKLQTKPSSQEKKLPYLEKFKLYILNIVEDQQYFSPSFLELHSSAEIQIIQSLKYELLAKVNNKNDSILEYLAFIDENSREFMHLDRSSFDIIENISIVRTDFIPQTQLQQKVQSLLSKIDSNQRQIQKLNSQKEEQQEQSERQFMTQSQIYKKQILKEKTRADSLLSGMESLRKIIWKFLEIWFSEDNMIDDLADCFEHYQGICETNDEKESKMIEDCLKKYEKRRIMIENNTKPKKKKWF